MVKNSIKALFQWILIFLIASICIFVMIRLMPGSPVKQLLTNYHLEHSDQNIQLLEQQWGLDKPLWQQYVQWIARFIQGDWGTSFITKLDIRDEFMKKLPTTFIIGFGGLLSSGIIAFFLGFMAAYKKNGFVDRFVRFLALFSQTIPNFILSIFVIYFFGVKLQIARFFTGNQAVGIAMAILFIVLYSVGRFALIVRHYFRSQMVTTHVIFAISCGFGKREVLLRHGWKPALYGLLASMLANFALIFGGSAVLEFAFGINGISYFLITSMKMKDYPVLQTYILFVFVWMSIIHFISQSLLRHLDIRSIAQ